MEPNYRPKRMAALFSNGIPLPYAWLAYLKNVNLVEEFGTGEGFWKIFAAGVRTVQVRPGQLRIMLEE